MGKEYNLMTQSYKDYTHYAATLTKQISQYFLEENLGVTVSIVDDVYIELLFKPSRVDFEKAAEQTEEFLQLVDGMPEIFGLEPIRTESIMQQKLDLQDEYNSFYYEKVILKGVNNG